MTVEPPPEHVLAAFGLTGVQPVPLGANWEGGWRCGEVVLSLVADHARAAWSARVRETLFVDGVRLARPVRSTELAGEKITRILSNAPGNDAPIDGLKVLTEHGWFAARPSGTEEIYKIYAESFLGKEHLTRLIEEAQKLVSDCFAAAGAAGPPAR